MYANFKKEILDEQGNVVFRNSFSLNMETTSDEVVEYFVEQGYEVTKTDKRIY